MPVAENLEEYHRILELKSKSDELLSNASYLDKAKPNVIDGERKKNSDFRGKLDALFQSIYDALLNHFGSDECIFWHIQYARETRGQISIFMRTIRFEEEWFLINNIPPARFECIELAEHLVQQRILYK